MAVKAVSRRDPFVVLKSSNAADAEIAKSKVGALQCLAQIVSYMGRRHV